MCNHTFNHITGSLRHEERIQRVCSPICIPQRESWIVITCRRNKNTVISPSILSIYIGNISRLYKQMIHRSIKVHFFLFRTLYFNQREHIIPFSVCLGFYWFKIPSRVFFIQSHLRTFYANSRQRHLHLNRFTFFQIKLQNKSFGFLAFFLRQFFFHSIRPIKHYHIIKIPGYPSPNAVIPCNRFIIKHFNLTLQYTIPYVLRIKH